MSFTVYMNELLIEDDVVKIALTEFFENPSDWVMKTIIKQPGSGAHDPVEKIVDACINGSVRIYTASGTMVVNHDAIARGLKDYALENPESVEELSEMPDFEQGENIMKYICGLY